MPETNINWSLVVCKATLSGIVALSGFLDQTISRQRARIAKRDSPSNDETSGEVG
jgi:hypothetical protein